LFSFASIRSSWHSNAAQNAPEAGHGMTAAVLLMYCKLQLGCIGALLPWQAKPLSVCILMHVPPRKGTREEDAQKNRKQKKERKLHMVRVRHVHDKRPKTDAQISVTNIGGSPGEREATRVYRSTPSPFAGTVLP